MNGNDSPDSKFDTALTKGCMVGLVIQTIVLILIFGYAFYLLDKEYLRSLILTSVAMAILAVINWLVIRYRARKNADRIDQNKE